MKEHPNFYENLKEAQMRLRGTVAMYDDTPYYVVSITNHKADGIFRMYLMPLGRNPMDGNRPHVENYNPEQPDLGLYLDTWLDQNPKEGYLRKMMNSPKFNKFRPFPLGMCNIKNGVSYIERQPNRKTEQGLIRTMLYQTRLSATPGSKAGAASVDIFGVEFLDTILGRYPTAQECLTAFADPTVSNEAVAFHRDFAFVRGPIGLLFLAYKEDVVGLLPNGDLSSVKLAKEFRHAKEAIADLGLFSNII